MSVLWAALWLAPAVAADQAYDHEVAPQCSSFAASPAPGVGRSVTLCATAGFSAGEPTPPSVSSRHCVLPYGGGFTVHTGDGTLTFCVSYMSQTTLPDVADGLDDVDTQNCPAGFVGIAVLVGYGGHASLCVQFETGIPHMLFPIRTDLSPCTPQAVDPAVYVGDGGVRVCIVVQSWPPDVEPPPLGPPIIDLSPCSAGTDPRVVFGPLDVAVCIEGGAQMPSGAPFGGLDDPCEHGVSLNSTLAGQTGRACIAAQP